jgi:hypothetical protein
MHVDPTTWATDPVDVEVYFLLILVMWSISNGMLIERHMEASTRGPELSVVIVRAHLLGVTLSVFIPPIAKHVSGLTYATL